MASVNHTISGLYAPFLKEQGHQSIVSLKRVPYEEIFNFYKSISRAPRQRPGGIEAIAFIAFVKYLACNLNCEPQPRPSTICNI